MFDYGFLCFTAEEVSAAPSGERHSGRLQWGEEEQERARELRRAEAQVVRNNRMVYQLQQKVWTTSQT